MKVSSFVLSIFLVISAMAMTTVSAHDWKVGDNGISRRDNNCRYVGDYIGLHKPSISEQCGGFCLNNSECTHFTYGDDG